MSGFLQDLTYALRTMRQAPGFTCAAIAALALGIGTNTAIFSVVNAVLLRPVPLAGADRLVLFMNTSPQGEGPAASPAKFQHWRAQASVVEHVAAFRSNVVNLTGGDEPEQLRAEQVSADYFQLLGAPILTGRTFTPEEDRPNGARVAVLSHGLWVRRFDRDPGVIGRTISISGEPHVVIGIVGPGFDVTELDQAPDLWVPFQLDPATTDQGHYFRAAGRIKDGVTLAQARARLQLSADDFRRAFPDALQPNAAFSVTPVQEAFAANVRQTLFVLLGAVSLVLLIACANVASLLLVRATARKREIAIRAALGAGRGRIVRQLLTESVLLSLGGGVLGVGLGAVGIRALLSVNTAGLPRVGQNGALVGLDWRVLAFVLVVSMASGVLFGLIPALQSSRADLNSTLKESGARVGGTVRRNWTLATIVVAEVALALVLLVGSALLIRTSLALGAVDPGFDPTNVLTMRMSLSGPRFLSSSAVNQVVRDGIERLRRMPGVEQASLTCCVPLEGGYGLPFTIVGRPLEQGPFHGGGGWLTVSPGYFEVFRMPVTRGRAFTDRDDAAAAPVVIINEAMARQFWPESDPLSDQLAIGRGVMAQFAGEPDRQIIGVVGDVRDAGLNNDPGPRMYVPQAQVPDAVNALNLQITPAAWVVRTRVEPYSLSGTIQEQLRQATGLPVSEVRSMTDVVSRSVSRQRFNMLLMALFAGSALLLAAIGVYGLMAYSVEQRTQEIGVRMALGAESGDVRRMIVRQGMRLAVAGVAIGVGAALLLTRFLASLLFGVQARDPMVFVGIPVLLTVVALVAVWVPARRASLVSPLAALRTE
jgi:predicted permease